MNKIKTITAAFAISTAFISTYSQAAIIVVDDTSFGIASVLRDTTNNREFLRLDLTMGYGYNGIIAASGIGGVFEGWSVASSTTMLDLATSEGISNGSTDANQIIAVENMRDWFCPTNTCTNLSSTHEYARGLVSDVGPDYTSGLPSQMAFSIGRRFNVNPEEVDFRLSGFGGLNATNEEIWMVGPSPVPVPAAIWLFGSGLIGLIGVTRRRKT